MLFILITHPLLPCNYSQQSTAPATFLAVRLRRQTEPAEGNAAAFVANNALLLLSDPISSPESHFALLLSRRGIFPFCPEFASMSSGHKTSISPHFHDSAQRQTKYFLSPPFFPFLATLEPKIFSVEPLGGLEEVLSAKKPQRKRKSPNISDACHGSESFLFPFLLFPTHIFHFHSIW